MIYIYSSYNIPIKTKASTNILDTEIFIGGYYQYTADNNDSNLHYFIYSSIIDVLCHRQDTTDYSQKLAEYLCLTGRDILIYNIILKLTAESNIINIDGIISFRLGNYMGDIKAFFDMMLYSEIIKKGFLHLGRNTIKFLEF